MPGFSFLFNAFVLLMGLAMAEVLRGFSRMLKLRARRRAGIDTNNIRIGSLTPLLGLFVIIDQSTFFLHMYALRDLMPLNGGTLLGILLTISFYYLIASMTFPDEPEKWPDFDTWFWLQKRFVIGGVIAVNTLSVVTFLMLSTTEQWAQIDAAVAQNPIIGLANLIVIPVFALMFWAFFSQSARLCVRLLVSINALTLIYGMLVFPYPQPG